MSKIIKVLYRESAYSPVVGEFYPLASPKIIQDPAEFKPDQTKNIFPLLGYKIGTPEKILHSLGIDSYDLTHRYECPYSGLEFFELTPLYLIADDLSDYGTFSDYDLDKEWHWSRNYRLSTEEFIVPDMAKSIIGPGYTQMTSTNDGTSSYEQVILKLDNGDSIIALTHLWFNK